MTNIEFLPAMLIGRVVWGIGTGYTSFNIERFMDETIPAFLLEKIKPTYRVSWQIGCAVAVITAIGMP